jgi:hypothetical protein
MEKFNHFFLFSLIPKKTTTICFDQVRELFF